MWNSRSVAGGEDTSSIVLRVFGRPPCPEDWCCVGRWSFAAAWLADDEPAARQLARARLTGACALATSAAIVAGRGDAERFTLVAALARLAASFDSKEGLLTTAADRAVDEMAPRLFHDGVALRSSVGRERAAFAPRFDLESFTKAMLEVGPERHVLLRDGYSSLESALASARGACPALRTLRLFLQATLTLEGTDASFQAERRQEGEEEPFRVLRAWLAADLALSQRRVGAFTSAWSKAARESGDALSLALAAVSSGGMVSQGLAKALVEEPWALPLALATTSEPDHASMLLDFGEQAQKASRVLAMQEIAAWRDQASAVEELENALGIAVIASANAREGFHDLEKSPGQDLFTAWLQVRLSREGTNALRQSVQRSTANEAERLMEEVREAEAKIEAVRQRYEAKAALARAQVDAITPSPEGWEVSEGRGQKGCLLGLGAGASVIATYVLVGFLTGAGRTFERIAPLIVSVAAVPVSVGILAYVATVASRTWSLSQRTRQSGQSRNDFERVFESLSAEYTSALENAQRVFQEASTSRVLFEQQSSTLKNAA